MNEIKTTPDYTIEEAQKEGDDFTLTDKRGQSNVEDILVPVEKLIPEINMREKKEAYLLSTAGFQTSEEFAQELWNKLEAADFQEKKQERVLDPSGKQQVPRKRSRPSPLKRALDSFSGQVVVDLGAGDLSLGYQICALAGARGYIGVEKHWAEQLKRGLSGIEEVENIRRSFVRKGLKFKKIPASVVAEHMLNFLARLPDNSVSIFASGIEDLVIPSALYREAVGREIERVLDPNGGFFSYRSDLEPTGLKDETENIFSSEIFYDSNIKLYKKLENK